jgi:hypothetical protein
MITREVLAAADQMSLIGKDGFKWAGSFYGTCYLENSGKDHCELPEGCEDTVIQIQVGCATRGGGVANNKIDPT